MSIFTVKFALRSLGKYKMYTLVNLLGLALATVSVQSVRAALRNPVESIAYE